MILTFSYCVTITSQAHPLENKKLILNNQTELTIPQVQLNYDEKLSLEKLKKLKIGIVAPEYTPYDIVDKQSNIYKGISADYLQLIFSSIQTNIEIEIIEFEKREDAIEAVKNNSIHLLTTSNNYESDSGLLLSQPYIIDQPALFIGDSTSGEIKTISMAYDYLPDEVVEKYFTKSTLINYPTKQAAAAAAAFGETDAVIMDLNSANSLINNIFHERLRLNEQVNINVKGTAFSTSNKNKELIPIINKVIQSIPHSINKLIRIRWNGGGYVIPETKDKPHFDMTEQSWINNNKIINLVINQNLAPLSYLDNSGKPTGYLVDIIELFKLYSGLNVNYIITNSFDEQQDLISKSTTPSMTVLTPTKNRAEKFLFSSKFSGYPYVYVKNKNESKIEHPIIAVPEGHAVVEHIKKHLNLREIKLSTNYLDALNMIKNNLADMTVIPLNTANYYNETYFGDELEISNVIFDIPAPYATFAVKNSEHILLDIINKTLEAIPPNEIQALENLWRSHELPMKQTWKDYQYTIYTILISSILLILASTGWGFFTRRHYRKRLEVSKALDKQLAFMQSIVDTIPHPIFVRNKLRELTLCNDSYLEAVKSTRENVIYKTTLDNVSRTKEVEDIDKEYLQALTDGKPVFKDRIIHIDGIKYNIYHWFKSYNDANGEAEGIIGGWIDISDRVKLVEELEKSKEAADSASQAKSTFLATMSHEIRTPMNAIIGMLELALKQANTPQFDFNTIKVAYDSANGLLELIGDILDIARIEAGQLTLAPVRCNLREVVTSVVRVFDGLARQKSLSLQLEYDGETSNDVLIDPMRIKQILSNLVGNAIKFTEIGTVKINVSARVISGNKQKVIFTVIDTGIGISAQAQEKLFTPFSQAHDSQNTYGGTGLGLMICRSLCEMMDGTLTLESELEKGTKVTMQLTLQQLDTETTINSSPILKPTANHRPLDILIVDDHPANRLLLGQQLRFLQHQIDEASDATIALKMFEQKEYKMVITDCNMPEISGYELARNIRNFEKNQSSKTTIIGYTANAQKEAKDACLAAGMDDCIFKPITLEELKNIIDNYNIDNHPHELNFIPEKVEKLTGNNPELVIKLLEELTKSNKNDLLSLDVAVRNKDLKSTKDIAHKIKGAARIIDANKLVIACEGLENTQINTIDYDAELVNIAIIQLEQEIITYLGK